MAAVTVTRDDFFRDRQGRTFTDLAGEAEQPLREVLAFLSDEARQRRMQESEIHHDRAPLAGVVRELEALPAVHRVLSASDPRRSQRLRQAVGVAVRIVMERLGWKKTGKKGSLGVRSDAPQRAPYHNTGGLSLWFLRAERYEPASDVPFATVKKRCRQMRAASTPASSADGRLRRPKASPGESRPGNGAARQETRRRGSE